MRQTGIFLVLLLISISCKKDSYNLIPDVRFSAKVNLELPPYNSQTRFIVEPYSGGNNIVGHKGVVVYTAAYKSIYYAFDLMCTHDHERPGYYYVDEVDREDFTMRCPECESEFNIAVEYGAVTKGPAEYALKRYQTEVRGGYELHIWN